MPLEKRSQQIGALNAKARSSKHSHLASDTSIRSWVRRVAAGFLEISGMIYAIAIG